MSVSCQSTSSSDTQSMQPPARVRVLAMLAISIAVFMAVLDTAVTNTALPTITRDLHILGADAVWIVTTYQLVMVAAMLPLGAIGEIHGHHRVFVAGLVLFTLSSLGCGLAWSLSSLVAARAIQGLGAAAIMSANTALVRFIYPEQKLGRGLGLNALVIAAGFAAGPTVASLILSVSTWHWLFLVNVPACGVAALLAWRFLPATTIAQRRFDWVAALLCAAMFAFIVHGIGEGTHQAPLQVLLAELALAVTCGYALARRQSGEAAPLLAVDLFRSPVFSLSAVAAICAFTAQGIAFVSLPFLLQTSMGRSQIETGFLITPWPVLGAIMAPISGSLSDKVPAGFLGGLGLALLSAGFGVLALLPNDASTVLIAGSMTLCGFGFGLFLSPNQRTIMSSAPPERGGAASGILGVARLLGQATGASLVALTLGISHQHGPVIALWSGCLFAGLGGVLSVLRLFAPRRA
ncbi:MFS transporter [Burkholderia sp. SCN-KJ]|uniref:MFS transporter n=1 Tax=Burkholderia sp. SCN-KJ TaxID=2969248 RepID=UPI00214FB4AF|nr:MFS transporter [Burkholderia sp. SCN-KJ]MCR4466221.1 MFS transporter [Burkholderia sp. SCN-KJ]